MLKKAHGISEELIEWRRDFHIHPEVGFEVQRTAGIVAETLERFGYRVRRRVGKTGVIGEIGEGGKLVAIRADMDALPILEQNSSEYVSATPGRMHACGHDAHTAMALGAAMLLAREKLPGRIRFLFQPAEEVADDEGLSGAQRMSNDGAMEGVDFVVAQHVDPASPVGEVGISPGACSGGVDSWFGVVRGTGGHGAHPHQTVDPFYLSAHVILALNGIVSRKLDPFMPAVVSIGTVAGGETENVIPERVVITGTLRFTQKDIQQKIHSEIERAFGVTRALGGDYELRFEIGSPPMVNDSQVSSEIEMVGKRMLGDANVRPLARTLGAEDFGSFLERAPGAMFTLGTQLAGHEKFLLHNPRFDIDERALPIGTAMLAELAVHLLTLDHSPKDSTGHAS